LIEPDCQNPILCDVLNGDFWIWLLLLRLVLLCSNCFVNLFRVNSREGEAWKPFEFCEASALKLQVSLRIFNSFLSRLGLSHLSVSINFTFSFWRLYSFQSAKKLFITQVVDVVLIQLRNIDHSYLLLLRSSLSFSLILSLFVLFS
jgi:hypothetical protein